MNIRELLAEARSSNKPYVAEPWVDDLVTRLADALEALHAERDRMVTERGTADPEWGSGRGDPDRAWGERPYQPSPDSEPRG